MVYPLALARFCRGIAQSANSDRPSFHRPMHDLTKWKRLNAGCDGCGAEDQIEFQCVVPAYFTDMAPYPGYRLFYSKH
jgi:hypothetical protein